MEYEVEAKIEQICQTLKITTDEYIKYASKYSGQEYLLKKHLVELYKLYMMSKECRVPLKNVDEMEIE